MTLQVLAFKFLMAVSPQAVHGDAARIVDAVVTAVQEERETVFGTREADVIILSYTSWAESNMHLHAVGDHGKAFGAFQLHQAAGRGSALTQARAALGHFRRDAQVCRRMPVAAFVSGNCWHGNRLARYRMTQIMAALRRARLA